MDERRAARRGGIIGSGRWDDDALYGHERPDERWIRSPVAWHHTVSEGLLAYAHRSRGTRLTHGRDV